MCFATRRRSFSLATTTGKRRRRKDHDVYHHDARSDDGESQGDDASDASATQRGRRDRTDGTLEAAAEEPSGERR